MIDHLALVQVPLLLVWPVKMPEFKQVHKFAFDVITHL